MSKHLAQALSGNETVCPAPSAHDKANEAHYFLHEMMAHYHECDRFRYSLSAFVQAVRNITFVLQSDLKSRSGFEAWYEPWQAKMKDNPDLQLLNSQRVRVVHQESLVPASSMFFGCFENGRYKLGLDGMPMNPMRDSIPSLIEARAHFDGGIGQYFVGPYRSCDCEEYGLTRTWSLPELNGVELTDFCARSFAAVVEVLSAAHEWCGTHHNPKVTCNHSSIEYRTLRESMVFPEVMKAWDGAVTERVLPLGETLPLRKFPFDDAEVLYTLTPKKLARGWVSMAISPYWPRNYASMLVYSVGGKRLRLRNSVFFDRTKAQVQLTRHQ
jgi:hypothetical protein